MVEVSDSVLPTIYGCETFIMCKELRIGSRKRLLKCYIRSVLLYGCESWTINKNMKQKRKATVMWFWRMMMRISWTEKLAKKYFGG